MITPARRLNTVKEYYFSKKLKQIARMQKAGKPVINLGIGSPDLPPSEEVIELVRSEVKLPSSHGYQSYIGIEELRDSFAWWYKEYFHVDLDKNQEILPLMGSKEGILYISLAFLNPGDEVLVPNPGYPTYQSVSKLVQAKIKLYELKDTRGWTPDFEALENENLDNVKLMWVNYPHMPTGTNASDGLFQKLVNFGKKHGILIVNDNPYSFILNDEPKSILAAKGAKDVAIELNSLSKSHNMAGWRIGMVAGGEEIINNILKVSSNVHSGMFKPLQVAAAKALRNPLEWYRQLNDTYRNRRNVVWKIFDLLGCQYDKNQSGLFVWAKIPDEWKDAESLSEHVLIHGNVFVAPGFIFGSMGERYLRISLCANMETLEEVVKRIQNIKP
jgi:hypothetical protein